MPIAVDRRLVAGPPPGHPGEAHVLAVVRALAREVGGDRAASAVSPEASLEREIGLGSLERVELLTRLESETGRELGDQYLTYDSAREIARALLDAPLRRDVTVPISAATPAPAAVRIDDATTLVDALQRRAAAEPTRVHVLLHEADEIRQVTYGELWDGAARIAEGLARHAVESREPVAIMLPTGLDYLQTFMGVLAAGGIAVPLYPPARPDRMEEYLQRQARILANAGVRLLVSMEEAVPVARLMRRTAPALAHILTAAGLRSSATTLLSPNASPRSGADDPALIQYTSGSTGDPKGVLLTHANLLANIRAIARAIDMHPTDAAVSWLPLYHDMGLIGTWLNAMVHAIPLTLMSPVAFLTRPERWLWAIHSQRATLSAAPNFAYELCVRKIRDADIEGLDLSSWRAAFNGSEQVSVATIERFVKRFERYGFRPEALVPVYGLAEASVSLCVPPLGRAALVDVVARAPFEREGRALPAPATDTGALRFVSVGRALPGHEVRVVDAQGGDATDRTLGRVVFRGPSCMAGYYHNPEATRRALLSGGWIDSGDLAYRSGSELFVTGRVKDLIKKGGRNLVPQEIEEVVGAVDGIRKGCVAAFGVADEGTGTERIVVLAESHVTEQRVRDRLERDAVAAVAAQTGVPPDVVRVVAPGVVPKTPSGKIRRSAAREAYVAGEISGRRGPPLRLRLGLLAGRALDATTRAARILGRALQVSYLVIVWSVSIVLLGPVILVLLYLLPAGRPVRTMSRLLAKAALAMSGCRLTVEGADALRRRAPGPLVLVTNHTSYADVVVLLAALPVDFVFVAMREIAHWRVVGTMARRGLHPTVDRWHVEQSVADTATITARLRAGEALVFFAEGGFSGMRGLKPFRLGAFHVAMAAGAPIVPVALRGTRELLPADTHIPRPRRVHVWIGAPIHGEGAGWRAAVALRARATEAVAAHCGEPVVAAAVASSAPPTG
jgi:1-acyl-sn-glycerol-3-phosphate acyltransferase